MKTINAFLKVKDFAKRMEIINSSIRTTSGVEQLKYAKDYFVCIENLKVPEALKALAQSFKKESELCIDIENVSGMFLNWSFVLEQRAEQIEELFPDIKTFKEAIGMYLDSCRVAMSIYSDEDKKILKKGIDAMVRGVELFVEDLTCLDHPVYIFETFVMPRMDSQELKPEIEEIELGFLN